MCVCVWACLPMKICAVCMFVGVCMCVGLSVYLRLLLLLHVKEHLSACLGPPSLSVVSVHSAGRG